MVFNKLIIKNFKQFDDLELDLNDDINILVGDNESGKSTILEAIALGTTGRFCGRRFEGFLSNDIFNSKAVSDYIASLTAGTPLPPPTITIELYAVDNPAHAFHKGKNNTLNEDVPGISYTIEYNSFHSAVYGELLKKGEIKDLPLEFYRSEWKDFAAHLITSYNNPISVSIIDTAQVNNNVIGSYIGREIQDSLTDDEIRNLGTAYRNTRHNFSQEAILQKLNTEIAQKTKIKDKTIGVALTSVTMAEWQKELSLSVDEIAFLFTGRGAQNIIKTNLALGKVIDKAIILLIEEPENNLSYTNMAKLIDEIIAENKGKQIFIATHSSFVVNKLGLDKIILLSKKAQRHLGDLPKDTINYFKKLPGYETLRVAIAGKIILVEGPTDELIIQAAYNKTHKKLPINNGIDIISVRSLAFKRFCDIAVLLKKPVMVVTDNDGSIADNITNKYSAYNASIAAGIISLFYEKDETLNTIEPSFLKANKAKLKELSALFGTAETEAEILHFMTNNKTEWALRIFDKAADFEYPEHINECIADIEK